MSLPFDLFAKEKLALARSSLADIIAYPNKHSQTHNKLFCDKVKLIYSELETLLEDQTNSQAKFDKYYEELQTEFNNCYQKGWRVILIKKSSYTYQYAGQTVPLDPILYLAIDKFEENLISEGHSVTRNSRLEYDPIKQNPIGYDYIGTVILEIKVNHQ